MEILMDTILWIPRHINEIASWIIVIYVVFEVLKVVVQSLKFGGDSNE